jgi:hypothetical protein
MWIERRRCSTEAPNRVRASRITSDSIQFLEEFVCDGDDEPAVAVDETLGTATK